LVTAVWGVHAHGSTCRAGSPDGRWPYEWECLPAARRALRSGA